MAEDVILSVKNISKSFGDLQVLREISFDIHEMNFAREVADRILFMEDGVIVEDAPPEEFLSIRRMIVFVSLSGKLRKGNSGWTT